MSAKKQFAGTPYARPPSTPRQQLARRVSTSGSILKALFTPTKWFSKKPTENQEAEDENADEEDEGSEIDEESARSDSGSGEEDEEEQVGLQSMMNQTQTPNTARSPVDASLQTPNALRATNSTSASPNSLLASFFTNKGDAPLTAIELEGVKAILARQSDEGIQEQARGQAPSYATPVRRPYQPIFTPANMVPATRAATEVKKVRHGYTPSTTVSSPFRARNPARTGFGITRTSQPGQLSTPAKYQLNSSIPANDSRSENGKRNLEEISASAAKRVRQGSPEEVRQESTAIPPAISTGNQTAASILKILDTDVDSSAVSEKSAMTQTPKRVLNPYSTSNSARKPSSTVKRSPVKRDSRGIVGQVTRGDVLDKRTPYQPKKSSGLSNSFTAMNENDTSLSSPHRGNGSPVVNRREEEPKASTKFSFTSEFPTAATTPVKAPSSTFTFDSQVTKPALFDSSTSLKTQSTTPKFSFDASQISSRSSSQVASTIDVDETIQDDATAGSIQEEISMTEQESSATRSAVTSTDDNSVPESSTHKSTAEQSDKPPVFSFANAFQNKSENKPSPKFIFGNTTTASPEKSGESDRDSDVVVHQLRDGTEYVSPSKTQSRPSSGSNNSSTKVDDDAPKTSGFVFTPTHSKSTPSFSFSNYKEPTKDAPVVGGFTFDPTKSTAAVIEQSVKPAKVEDKKAVPKAPEPDVKARIMTVLERDLPEVKFTVVPHSVPDEVQNKVLTAQLIDIKFTVSKSSSVVEQSSSGFNWAAAGMQKPESNGWSCEVCMVSNTTDATQCISCESSAPTKSGAAAETGTKTTTPSAASGGVFNWAAAGMKAPVQQWSCSVCMTSNPDSAQTCLACEADR